VSFVAYKICHLSFVTKENSFVISIKMTVGNSFAGEKIVAYVCVELSS
jgi:hypothetical protein